MREALCFAKPFLFLFIEFIDFFKIINSDFYHFSEMIFHIKIKKIELLFIHFF